MEDGLRKNLHRDMPRPVKAKPGETHRLTFYEFGEIKKNDKKFGVEKFLSLLIG